MKDKVLSVICDVLTVIVALAIVIAFIVIFPILVATLAIGAFVVFVVELIKYIAKCNE